MLSISVSIYAPSEASDLTVVVLGDFNASTGTDGDGYETCIGPHGSGPVNHNVP